MFLVSAQMSLFGVFIAFALSLALFTNFRKATFAFAQQFIQQSTPSKSLKSRQTKLSEASISANKTSTKAQKLAAKKRSIAKQASTPQHKNRN